MMFIILTHDNQSILSSFSVFMSLWQSPVAEKSHSGSTITWAWLYLRHGAASKVIWPLFCSLKKTHFLYHNLWSDLFLCRNSFVVFKLMDYMDSVFWFQMALNIWMQQQFQFFFIPGFGSWKKTGFRVVENGQKNWVSGSGKPGWKH